MQKLYDYQKKHYLLSSGNGNLLFFRRVSCYCLWFSQVAEVGKMLILRNFPDLVSFCCSYFRCTLGTLGFRILSIVDNGHVDLGMWHVLDICVLVWFSMFDVGEDLGNGDSIGLCECIFLGKGFGQDDEVCSCEANCGFDSADMWWAKYNMKNNCNFNLNNSLPQSDLDIALPIDTLHICSIHIHS